MCPGLICYFLQNPHFTLLVEFIFPHFSIENIALVFYKERYLETALNCTLKQVLRKKLFPVSSGVKTIPSDVTRS